MISLFALVIFIVTGQSTLAAPLFKELWKGYLVVALSVTAAMIFVYGTQNTTLGLVVFIFLIANFLDFILTAISLIPFFADHNINLALILPSNLLLKKSARPCHLHGDNLPPFRKKLATLPDPPATSDFASIIKSAHD